MGESAHAPQERSADVVIVGYGPVGATAANLLGTLGLDVVVVERDPSVFPRARAISTDEEVLRIWQWVGLADRLEADMLAEKPIDFVDDRGASFMSLTLRPRGNGHPPQMFIYQPAVDTTLREGVACHASVEVLLGYEMREVVQCSDSVSMTAVDVNENDRARPAITVRARYLLACDGGSSLTRAALGIGFEGKTYEDRWLVVDTKVRAPWPEVDRLRFHCDPARPAVDCPTPLGHHRWEFPVLPGEDEAELAGERSVWMLLARHGITPEHVQILRSVVYTHHVRFADRWRCGRVFLMGDAAHVMPPWIGQGMAAGVRDAGNLCWKLAAVVRGEAGDALLDSYQQERAPHVRDVTKRATFFGAVITERSRTKAAVRNVAFRAAMRTPFLGDYLRSGRWMPPARYADGLMDRANGARAAGLQIPQPIVETAHHARMRIDDALGLRWTLLVLPDHPLAAAVREPWEGAGARVVTLVRGAPAGDDQLREHGSDLTDWMRAHDATALVLRPDQFVYAAGSATSPLAVPPTVLTPMRKVAVP